MFPQRVNSNLADLSEGPLRAPRPHSFSERELEVKDQQATELASLLSHMSWLVDLNRSLTEKLPQRPAEVIPLLSEIAGHMEGIQAILTDRTMTN